MISEGKFQSNAQRKFLQVLKEANKGVITDIEVIANDFVRFGLLKKLTICPSRTKFTEPEIREALDTIAPTRIGIEMGKKELFEVLPVGFSFSIQDVGHYRVLASLTKHGLSLSIRKLPFLIPDIEVLGIPPRAVNMFTNAKDGLFLVTGPTGSGKTTTIASMLEYINQQRFSKIITIENPIEYVFVNAQSAFYQIEIGTHVSSIEASLYHVLRSNPEIIFIGEVRSPEEARACLSAAETGHVVITSYHVPDTVAAIERLIYEIGDSEVTRRVIASSLIAVLNQKLFVVHNDRTNGESSENVGDVRFVYACELLPVENNPVVKKKIIDMDFLGIRKIFEDPTTKFRELGLITFNDSMRPLYLSGVVSKDMILKNKYYDFTLSLRE